MKITIKTTEEEIQEFIALYCFEFHEAQFRGKMIPFRTLKVYNYEIDEKNVKNRDSVIRGKYYITPLGDKIMWNEGWEINGKEIPWEFED